mgnify:CR=1 FL=1
MPTDLTDRHYLPAGFDNRTINILLVGCGGNGGGCGSGSVGDGVAGTGGEWLPDGHRL